MISSYMSSKLTNQSPSAKHPASADSSTSTPPKFCSSSCRSQRPSTLPDSIDARTRDTFLSLLPPAPNPQVVMCSVVEEHLFNRPWRSADTMSKASPHHANNFKTKTITEGIVSRSQDPPADDPIPQTKTSGAKDNQVAGMQRAKQREMVRRCARRMVVFGIGNTSEDTEGAHQEGGGRELEAVQNNRVVEASFAKGEWGIRWKIR